MILPFLRPASLPLQLSCLHLGSAKARVQTDVLKLLIDHGGDANILQNVDDRLQEPTNNHSFSGLSPLMLLCTTPFPGK